MGNQVPPGAPLPGTRYYHGESEWAKGLGRNLLRTRQFAQPYTLMQGDRLATGDELMSPPRQGNEGEIFLHLRREDGQPKWVAVPSIIPIALWQER